MSAVTKYLSPDKVVEFCNAIFDAGIRLSALLTAEYPKSSLVSEALYNVTKVVENNGLEDKWVTSWVRTAKIEFVATSEVREVSASMALFNKACVFLRHLLNILFRLLCRR